MDNIAVHTFLACVCWISFKLSAFETICHEQRDINLSLCVVANMLFVNIQESQKILILKSKEVFSPVTSTASELCALTTHLFSWIADLSFQFT